MDTSDEEKIEIIANNEDLLQFVRRSKPTKEIEEVLLKKGVTIHYENVIEGTALHIATQIGNKGLVEFLISKGADVTKKNQLNKTPLDIVEEKLKTRPHKFADYQEIKDILDRNTPCSSSGEKNVCNPNPKISLKLSEMDLKRKPVDDDFPNHLKKKRRSDPELDKDKHYKASGVKLALHSTIYQVKLLMLFVLKGIEKQYDFRLATEMDEAEKFDDVVFKYKDDNDKWVYSFLQAKHALKSKITCGELASPEETDFSLQKYFISFYKIKYNMHFAGDDLKDFILCTNTDFDFELSIKITKKGKEDKRNKSRNDEIRKWKNFLEIKSVSQDDLIYVSPNERQAKFKKDKETRSLLEDEMRVILQKKLSILKDSKNKSKEGEVTIIEKILCNDSDFEKDLNEFFEKFRFIINYPNEQQINDFINLENQTNLLNADLVINSFEIELLQWLKNENLQAKFYTWKDGETFFRNMRSKINNLMTSGLGVAYPEEL